MARDGADSADVAECVMRGVELDIRRDGGAPAYSAAVEILLAATAGGDSQQVLKGADVLNRTFVDSPLTRHFAKAVELVGLSAIANGHALSWQEASEKLLAQFAESRCCDGMTGYIARNRTKAMGGSQAIVESIKSHLGHTASVRDLAERMQRCSANGLPARAAKVAPVAHTADGLNEEL